METAVLNTSSTKENVAIFLLRSVPEYSCSHFVLCLPGILYCFCNVPITCSVTWHRKITWLRARPMLITYPVMFYMFWGLLILRNPITLYVGPTKLKVNIWTIMSKMAWVRADHGAALPVPAYVLTVGFVGFFLYKLTEKDVHWCGSVTSELQS